LAPLPGCYLVHFKKLPTIGKGRIFGEDLATGVL